LSYVGTAMDGVEILPRDRSLTLASWRAGVERREWHCAGVERRVARRKWRGDGVERRVARREWRGVERSDGGGQSERSDGVGRKRRDGRVGVAARNLETGVAGRRREARRQEARRRREARHRREASRRRLCKSKKPSAFADRQGNKTGTLTVNGRIGRLQSVGHVETCETAQTTVKPVLNRAYKT